MIVTLEWELFELTANCDVQIEAHSRYDSATLDDNGTKTEHHCRLRQISESVKTYLGHEDLSAPSQPPQHTQTSSTAFCSLCLDVCRYLRLVSET